MRKVLVAVALAFVASVAVAEDRGMATATVRGQVIHVMYLSDPDTGEPMGRIARVQAQGYIFVVRCFIGSVGCEALERAPVGQPLYTVVVRGLLTPSYLDSISVHRR